MVLWEIALGTAYFLGIKRTYRLAFKIQRRIISRNHPRLQQFVHRRTRALFDVVIKVHKNIQHRDLQVGRDFGNWILRCLDKMKPSAEIRAVSHQKPHHIAAGKGNANILKQMTSSFSLKPPRIIRPNSFPTIALMMRPPTAAGNATQCRHLCINGSDRVRVNYARGEGVVRKDIMEWMVRR